MAKDPPKNRIPVPPPRQYKLRPLPPMRPGAMQPNPITTPKPVKKKPGKKKGK